MDTNTPTNTDYSDTSVSTWWENFLFETTLNRVLKRNNKILKELAKY